MKALIILLSVSMFIFGCQQKPERATYSDEEIKQSESNEETTFVLMPEDVESIEMISADGDKYNITIKLSEEKGKEFTELTKKMLGKKLPLVIDGETMAEPKVMEVIPGNTLTLSGKTKEQIEKMVQYFKK